MKIPEAASKTDYRRIGILGLWYSIVCGGIINLALLFLDLLHCVFGCSRPPGFYELLLVVLAVSFILSLAGSIMLFKSNIKGRRLFLWGLRAGLFYIGGIILDTILYVVRGSVHLASLDRGLGINRLGIKSCPLLETLARDAPALLFSGLYLIFSIALYRKIYFQRSISKAQLRTSIIIFCLLLVIIIIIVFTIYGVRIG